MSLQTTQENALTTLKMLVLYSMYWGWEEFERPGGTLAEFLDSPACPDFGRGMSFGFADVKQAQQLGYMIEYTQNWNWYSNSLASLRIDHLPNISYAFLIDTGGAYG